LNEYYRQCLSVCKQLHQKEVVLETSGGEAGGGGGGTATVTADKLLYSYAIEMVRVLLGFGFNC